RFLKILHPGVFKDVHIFIHLGKRLPWGGLTMEDIRKVPWISEPAVEPQPDDTAAILFTPGNTGPAKGVVHTHGNLAARIRLMKDRFDIAPDEIDLVTVSSFAFFGPALGLTSVIPDMDPARPALVRPENIIQTIIDQGVTNIFASPALLDRVGQYARNYNISFPSLKRVISMDAPLSPVCMERFEKTLPQTAALHILYGALEATPVMSIGSAEILSETKGLSEKGYGECIGRPINDMEVRLIQITDDPVDTLSDDLLVPQGEIGEIIVKGSHVSENYPDNPDWNALQKIREAGGIWHRMGDLGWMDKNSRFWFCGRKSHRVITEKGTLYPIPCEAIFNAHPDVCRSALVGIGPSENKTPVLCVELEQSDALDQKRIETELLTMAEKNVITQGIKTILFHKQLPTDTRHQTKINREELAIRAEKQRK
ncbi:MAG: fatty acid CoA ligase family protein, partial [Clostridia bacterium]